jgi:opacity protein-like surface antigen
MKRLVIIFFVLALIVADTAQGCCQPDNYTFYIKVGSGVSCSESTAVCAPFPPWNPAVGGYNAKVGNCAIASFSVGCELWDVLDVEASISNRSVFKYKKFQTPTAGGDSYVRNFDLNITTILVAANLLGRGACWLHWDVGCGQLYPLLGVGLGMSNLLITNFRTTCLPVTGDSSPYASFASENQYTLRKNFTYTLAGGIEYNHASRWAIGTGYRWFNAGHFRGPQYNRVASGAAVDVGCDTWKMRFRSHEWFAEFKIFV